MTIAPHDLGAIAALRWMADGTLTPEALMQSCLERIAQRDPQVRAFHYLDGQSALDAARRPAPGALSGLPVGLKDIFDTIDMPTEYGSVIYRGHQPRRDATAVARLRQAGAIAPGKTVTTEFAGLCPGMTRNPRNLDHTPGGSSSGSAAAVADRMVPLAIGTQTGGSIIRPAAFCGIVGIKPSFGLIDRTGVRPAVEAYDTIGTFSRNLADGALLLSVLAGNATLSVGPNDAFVPRIGICRTLQWDAASKSVQASIETAAERLEHAGAVVSDFALPTSFEGLLDAQGAIMDRGTLDSTYSEWLYSPDRLTAPTRAFCERGTLVTLDQLREAHRALVQAREDLDASFGEIDVLITPSTIDEAPAGLETTGDALFIKLWTALHVPAITLPFGVGPVGLPLGLQVVGHKGDDRRTLAASIWIESVLLR